jgi:hypothetical protein
MMLAMGQMIMSDLNHAGMNMAQMMASLLAMARAAESRGGRGALLAVAHAIGY